MRRRVVELGGERKPLNAIYLIANRIHRPLPLNSCSRVSSGIDPSSNCWEVPWLNLIECAFSKMARTFLRHIRVKSIDELKARILKGIAEFNASPVVFRWNKFDLGVA